MDEVSEEHYPLLTAADLTPGQHRWRPRQAADLYFGVLPWKSEIWPERDGGPPAIQLTSGGPPPWDWRTCAFWDRALPGWSVQLSHSYRATLTPPVGPPGGWDEAEQAWTQAGAVDPVEDVPVAPWEQRLRDRLVSDDREERRREATVDVGDLAAALGELDRLRTALEAPHAQP